jgi:glycosyltransferase involved in cell wall biosynthesis
MIHVNVVVPFSRPENIPAVVANFQRQTYPHKSLIVVENGAGLGKWPAGLGLVIRAPLSKSAGSAKNAAMNHLRQSGQRWMCVMDDDDYYSPGYLSEQVVHMPRYAIVGKNQHFLVDKNGFWLLNAHVHSCLYHWCSGGVQCLDLTRVGSFRTTPTEEDVYLCHDALHKGQQVYISSPYNYLWERRGAHTYQEDAIQRAVHWGLKIDYLGKHVDLDVVSGRKPIVI